MECIQLRRHVTSVVFIIKTMITIQSFTSFHLILQYLNILDAQKDRFGGLIVVGSYVPKTTAQLNALLQRTEVSLVQLDVAHFISLLRNNDSTSHAAGNKSEREKIRVRVGVVTSLSKQVADLIAEGRDVVLSTSRQFVPGTSLDDTKEVILDCCYLFIDSGA